MAEIEISDEMKADGWFVREHDVEYGGRPAKVYEAGKFTQVRGLSLTVTEALEWLGQRAAELPPSAVVSATIERLTTRLAVDDGPVWDARIVSDATTLDTPKD